MIGFVIIRRIPSLLVSVFVAAHKILVVPDLILLSVFCISKLHSGGFV